LFLPYLGTAPANADAALAGVLAEIDRLRRDPVEVRELARAKAWLLGNLAMDRQTSARHAWYLAVFELLGGGWDWPERYARAVEAVTVGDPGAGRAFMFEFGATPCRLSGACVGIDDFPSPLVTVFTSMFMHSLNPIHVAGNMLYLWIFGDNIEDSLGHGRFLVFYLLAG